MNFMSKAQLGGIIDLEMGVLFDFSDKGIRAVIADRSAILFANVLLKKDAIKDYELREPIGIKDIGYLQKIVGLLDDDIDFSVIGNKLRLMTPSKIFEITLADPKTIYVSEIQVAKDQVEEWKSNSIKFDIASHILKSMTYKLKDLSKDTIITFKTEQSTLTALAKFNTDQMIEKLSIPEIAGEEKATFTVQNIEYITNTLTADKVTVYLKTDCPIIIEEHNDIFDCWYILCPRLEE